MTMADDTATAIVTTYNGVIAGGASFNNSIAFFYGNSNKILSYNQSLGVWQSDTIAPLSGTIGAAAAVDGVSVVLITNNTFVTGSVNATVAPAVTTAPRFAFVDPQSKLFIACHADGKIQTRATIPTAAAWVERTLPPTWGTNDVFGGCFGLSTSLVVGANGRAAWSRNGAQWFQAGVPSSVSSRSLRAACFSGNDFLVVGDGGTLLRSVDGQNLTEVTSPTTVDLYACQFDGLHYYIGGNSGQIWRSTDLETWTQFTNDSGFGTTNVRALALANGKIIAAGGTNKVQKADYGIRVLHAINGYESAQHLYLVRNSSAAEPKRALNCTTPALTIVTQGSGDYEIANCDFGNFAYIINENSGDHKATECLVRHNFFHVFNGSLDGGKFLTVEKTTVVGSVFGYSPVNANTQGFNVRCCIFNAGTFINIPNANASDSALRGYISPNISFGANVFNLDPLFIDPPTDYRLATVAERPQNSPYLGKSTLFAPNGSAGTGRDLGAYSFDLAGLVESWTKAVVLPKPASSSFAIKPRAFYTPTRGGDPSGINRPNQWVEEISVAWTQLDAGQFAELMSLSTQESVRVRLTWDSILSTSSVTVSGNQSAGSPVLVIASQAVNPGSFLTIGGKKIYVYRVIAGSPTTLVLSSNLPASVTNGDVLPLTNVAGAGEYIMRWPDIERSRIQYARPLDDSNWRGVKVSFERRRVLA